MEKMGREEILEMYYPAVEQLSYYLPWFENRTGKDVTSNYHAEGQSQTLAFPVYDSVLLSFLNDLSQTVFMNQNYRYTYTKYHMHDYEDEWNMIDKADIMSMDILQGILSKYMLGGLTKATLWTQGVEYQIFYRAVKKAKEIIEFWTVPLQIETIPMEETAEEIEEAYEESLIEEAVEEAAEAVSEETAETVSEEAFEDIAEAAETVEDTIEDTEEVEETVDEVIEEVAENVAEEMTEEPEAVEDTIEDTEEVEETVAEVSEEEIEMPETIEEVQEVLDEVQQISEELNQE